MAYIVIPPLAYADKSLPGPPWSNASYIVNSAYNGVTPQHVTMSCSKLWDDVPGSITYAIKDVTGPVKITVNCLLKSWLSNGTGLVFKIQHVNSTGDVNELFSVTRSDINSDSWFTLDYTRGVKSREMPAVFTGDDRIVFRVEGSGNTGPFSVEIYDILAVH